MTSKNISKNTRPAKAGEQMGKALLETIHLLYLNKNALCFLHSLIETLKVDLKRRKKEWDVDPTDKRKVKKLV